MQNYLGMQSFPRQAKSLTICGLWPFVDYNWCTSSPAFTGKWPGFLLWVWGTYAFWNSF